MRTQKIAHATLAALSCGFLCFIAVPSVQAQTQDKMNETAARDADKADAAMNAAYKKLMAVLEPSQKAQLKKPRRAWLVFRDAEANLLSSKVEGGSIYPMMYSVHVWEITQEHTRELTEAHHFFMTEDEM